MARLIAAFCAFFALGFAAPAAAQSFNAQEQAEIRALMRDYLVRNPDVLREALDALQARVDAERRIRAETDPRDYTIGRRDAPVTVVQFFDYRCPFCMTALPWVLETTRTNRDVRFVFKEMPLAMHGQEALEASQASIAAMPQGKYLQFHRALMSFRGELSSARIDQLARESGIDVPRMRRAMSDERIVKVITDNEALATDLGATGTPAWLVNGHMISGFRNAAEMNAAIRDAARLARESRTASR